MTLQQLLTTLAALACAGVSLVADAKPVAEAPWAGAREVASNGDGYLLRVAASVEPLPENEVFELSVWVFDPAEPEVPLEDAELAADAGMPEHGHGMNRMPAVARRADGGFDVTGMLFHMGGSWELYLDVTRGAITERAQTRVELE
ncbi:MAG TPA: FixH family protein [Planctomycetota bacterium]|nr:FixH family protein [Planctomycetota bacterium]